MSAPLAWALALPVREPSQVGEARRRALALADEQGFSQVRRGELAIVVSELCSNLCRHATQGAVLLRPLPGPGVEVIALDRGPGMADVSACLRDGYSTAGSAGIGLGAVVRLSAEFDIYSQPSGTVVLARLFRDGRPPKGGGGRSGPQQGLPPGFPIERYPGLLDHDPAILAAAIYSGNYDRNP
jgi:anti-sigma regulatory factor (Ser/Thr protein kinase)